MFSRTFAQRLFVASCVFYENNARRPSSSSSSPSHTFATSSPPAASVSSVSPTSTSFRAARTRALQSKLSARMHGTVTAFKHRRGYGFVLAEGFVSSDAAAAAAQPSTPSSDASDTSSSSLNAVNDAAHASSVSSSSSSSSAAPVTSDVAQLGKSYFFFRSALNEGFYITEGERVSFNVVPTARHISPERAYRDNEAWSVSTKAIRMRMYDPRTGKESLILPIMLKGKVVQWDVISGRGVIAELDMEKNLHPDSPRFTFGLDNLALPENATIAVGRYVCFCILPAESTGSRSEEEEPPLPSSTTATKEEEEREAAGGIIHTGGEAGLPASMRVADRIIFDREMELTKKEHVSYAAPMTRGGPNRDEGAHGRAHNELADKDRSYEDHDSTMIMRRRLLSHATPSSVTMTDESGQPVVFTGVVRERTPNGYGFVIDDYTGKSLFFHDNQSSADVRPGQHVMYNKQDIVRGKHAGKVSCVHLRPIDTAKVSENTSKVTGAANDELFSETDIDDFDLLD